MSRVLVFTALLLVACPQKKAAELQPPTAHASTLKCAFEAPAGWTTSASPMPDQVLEVLATAPKLRGRMVVREAAEPTLGEAAEAAKRRTGSSWGGQPDFTLLREDPLGEGRVIAYQWRPQPSAPVERHLVVVLTVESRILLAHIDDDGMTPEQQLLATLGTLKCSPK